MVVLDVRSAAHLEAFLIKQGMLFLNVSNVLRVCRGVRMRSHVSYTEAWIVNFNTIPYSSKTCLRITVVIVRITVVKVCSYCLNIGQDQLNIALTM